jgi:uncharacterized protein (DUF305 family)
MKTITSAAILATALASGTPCFSQDHHGGHSSHAQPAAAETPAAKAFDAANARMHKDMTLTYSGDTDTDFVRGMIPHHLGAIDMARIALQYGKSPEIRKLAQEIIAAQEKEIAWMKDWLAKNAK